MKERLGPVQIAALEYVRDNPGCTQAQAAEHAGAHGRNAVTITVVKHGVRAVQTLRSRGLIDATPRPGGGYLLTLSTAGAQALDNLIAHS
jgi:hypothetical protein